MKTLLDSSRFVGLRNASTSLLLLPPIAFAEVIDKIATPRELWTNNLTLGLFACALAFVISPRWLPTNLLLGIAIWFAAPPVVEPEFIREAVQHYGPSYTSTANLAAWLVPLGVLLGAACKLGWRHRRQRDA